jgi:hypothetical protein
VLERLARDKYISSLRTFVNYGRKKFITSGPGANVISFFVRNLQIFVKARVFVPAEPSQLRLPNIIALNKNSLITE